MLNIAVKILNFHCLLKLLCPQKHFTHKNYGNGNKDVESVFKNELNREIKNLKSIK